MAEQPLLREVDDVPTYDISREVGPIDGWASGYFWWTEYNIPGYVTVSIGVAGDICFPLYSQWADGCYYQLFVLRYDRARKVAEMLSPPGELGGWYLNGTAASAADIEVFDDEEFQPDVLLSELTQKHFRIKLLRPEQAAYLVSDFEDAPPFEHVWRPVDVGQKAPEFVSDEEAGVAELLAEDQT